MIGTFPRGGGGGVETLICDEGAHRIFKRSKYVDWYLLGN